MKVIVFGGNGYVGTHIIKSLISLSSSLSIPLNEIVSISRSGLPINKSMIISNDKINIKYHKADIFDYDKWKDIAIKSDAFVSTIGAFGSNEWMQKINGDANIFACSKGLKLNVSRFVYISTVDNNLPNFILKGYFQGKQRAEHAIQDAYPDNGFILKPGFIYGNRYISETTAIPLHLIGKPMDYILNISPFNQLKTLPYLRAIFERPISVECVGKVAAAAALGKIESKNKYLKVEDIVLESKRF